MKTAFLCLLYELQSILSQYPKIFFPLLLLRPKNRNLIVRKQTEITIEGFPRSGNTFSVVAFQVAQQRPVVIARHTHAPAQVINAVNLGIPVMVLIRKPVDAISSLLIRQPHMTISQGFRSYNRYYNRIMPYKNQYIVATFDEIISNYGNAIKRINQFFGCSFKTFVHTKENIKKCFEVVEQMDKKDTGRRIVTEISVGRPSQEREKLKDNIKKEFEKKEIKNLIVKADIIYNKFTELT